MILFYRYVPIDNVDHLQTRLRGLCDLHGLLGRVLCAKEGINGTLSGTAEGIDRFVADMQNDVRFRKVDWKRSEGRGSRLPFPDLHIKCVSELIGCGQMSKYIDCRFDPESYGGLVSGKHLEPEEFNREIATKSDTALILDIRNSYEYDIGHFKNAR